MEQQDWKYFDGANLYENQKSDPTTGWIPRRSIFQMAYHNFIIYDQTQTISDAGFEADRAHQNGDTKTAKVILDALRMSTIRMKPTSHRGRDTRHHKQHS